MSSITSLFGCASADMTFDAVSDLVAQNLPEGLTLEYKQTYAKSIPTSVAAMANSYGGLILVGVLDGSSAAERICGVDEQVIVQIVNACHDRLEPPFQPEMISVAIPNDEKNRIVLVIRVDSSRVPRPILENGAAPIRLQGRNAIAPRAQLAALFKEPTAPSNVVRGGDVTPPQMPRNDDGSPAADLMVRSGIQLTLGESASWRPLSERSVDALAAALNNSPLSNLLHSWSTSFGAGGINPFSPRGFNRSRHAHLTWQAMRDGHLPLEANVEITLPNQYGGRTTAHMTVDVLARARSIATDSPPWPWKVAPGEIMDCLSAVVAGIVDEGVVKALAALAGIDPVLVPQPSRVFFLSGPPVHELMYLDGLRVVPDAGDSFGATLTANPSLDLANSADLLSQTEDWLVQIALDAGLRGMETLIRRSHEITGS